MLLWPEEPEQRQEVALASVGRRCCRRLRGPSFLTFEVCEDNRLLRPTRSSVCVRGPRPKFLDQGRRLKGQHGEVLPPEADDFVFDGSKVEEGLPEV